MAFKIVQGAIDEFWCAGDGTSTYYMGQLVSFGAASKAATPGTVVPLAVPAGAADTTNFQIPAGVVVGFNRRTPQYDATTGLAYDGGTIVAQATQLARDWAFNGGMYSPGDPQLLIKVALIGPMTLIEGPIYNDTYGTACATVTDTAGSATGYTTAGTTSAAVFTPVANICSIYCRTGANAGLYRTTNDTSTTAPDATVAFPYDVAIGDVFVRVPLKQGLSEIYIDGPGLFIDQTLTATNNYQVIVKRLDLAVSGQEKAQFWFTGDHFANERA